MNPELNEGEMVCSKCNGEGEIPGHRRKFCPKCKGKGKLDWIENIMGVHGTRVTSGVYVQEIDYSTYISREVEIIEKC